MKTLFERLNEDVRFIEGLKACLNCGTCTAICPAAEFYDYHPRVIVDIVQTKDDKKIEDLLKSETIWYCGECMSCKTRCPRGNAPGLIIMALRALSQELGYFTESEKGRQQLAVKRSVGEWILKYGYCLYLAEIGIENHPEQGPVWEWEHKNIEEIMIRVGANYNGEGAGVLRKIPEEALDEIKKIFEVTGGKKRFEDIENYSKVKAIEMGLDLNDGLDNDYFRHIYTTNSKDHTKS
jgi:heterodisulfide reductase subunit C1